MGIYDIPSKYLIEEVATKLKVEIKEPEFVRYVKTGVNRERAPQRQDWFYVRMGSILYRAYKWNVIGSEGLRTYYGGRQRKGVKTEHHHKASGKVIRSALQKLEEAGYLERAKPRGRQVSPKGQKFLNELSKLVAKNIEEGKYITKKVVKKEDAKAKEVQDELRKQEKAIHDKEKEAKEKKESHKVKKKEGENEQ